MKRYEQERPFVEQFGPGDQQLNSPFRHPTPRSDWATPLLISATIAGILALLFAAGIAFVDDEPGALWISLKVGFLTFLIVLLPVYIVMTNRMNRSLYHTVNHKKPKENAETRPIVHSAKGKWESEKSAVPQVLEGQVTDDCPYRPQTMCWFVWFCASAGTGYEVWEPELGRKKYTYWRDALLDAGWADWNSYGPDGKPNNTQGWKLIAEPDVIIDHIKE